MSRFSPLTPEEIEAWTAAAGSTHLVRARRVIREEGDPSSEFYILYSGWVASYVATNSGDRLLSKIHLPGEVVGSPSMCSDQATETLLTLTAVELASVSFEAFGSLMAEHPRLTAEFVLAVQMEHLALTRRLIASGRQSAEAGIASFLLSILERLERSGLGGDGTFDFPPTQQQIADATGLTPIHVNRILRRLREAEVLETRRRTLRVMDAQSLRRIAGTQAAQPRAQYAWLPPSRVT